MREGTFLLPAGPVDRVVTNLHLKPPTATVEGAVHDLARQIVFRIVGRRPTVLRSNNEHGETRSSTSWACSASSGIARSLRGLEGTG